MESWFKTASDGRTIFYPWGNLNKQGYVMGSADDFRRLRTQINIYLAMSLASMAVATRWGFPAVAATGGLSLTFYFVWMRRIIRALKPYYVPEETS